ncbi:hypothetical protein GCM10015535_69650 [Streptomyces gelaticus]|uniref:Teneurin-like YD-shell domain-containing protein n=1 Tax=Streptomyces gelaticus TaxID=285446 RepID=A0ABQ2W9Z0_9ACTN|nr:RHS repeat-associated core domain-containing protein [Streptomyces gelaticus]GGV97743.1 hypothetical protein GCM10015535_69650 [Streptomyces gelaticus]
MTGPNGTVSYDYDAADRRKTMSAGGQTTVYGFDKSSILTSVVSGTQEVGFGLDAVGREKTATMPGGIARTTGYDKTGTIKSITYAQGASSIGDLNYTRDERGLQTGLTGTLANVALPAAEDGTVFGKDNRITTYGGRSFTYDADGQLKTDGIRDSTWNARGQLSGLTKAGQSSSFGYDALGTRSTRTVGGTTNKFLTDGSNPLVEQDSSGDTTATVATSGLDQFLTRTENGTTQIYLTDALGSVIGLANSDGTIATKYAYDPNGQPTVSGAASSNPYTFTGRENDGTGLLYYRDRYYDPETGRFISQDPIGQAGGTKPLPIRPVLTHHLHRPHRQQPHDRRLRHRRTHRRRTRLGIPATLRPQGQLGSGRQRRPDRLHARHGRRSPERLHGRQKFPARRELPRSQQLHRRHPGPHGRRHKQADQGHQDRRQDSRHRSADR